MEEIIKNENNLNENDITNVEIRVKAILINDKNEVLVGYAGNRYQFIGGHVEENEDLLETAEREILEESGITINIDKTIKPVAKYTAYYKDYPIENENRKNEIYYYIIKCNEEVDYSKTNYTELEKQR